MLNERLQTLAPILRSDVKTINADVALDILRERGLLKPGQKTIFDYFKFGQYDNEEGDINEREEDK